MYGGVSRKVMNFTGMLSCCLIDITLPFFFFQAEDGIRDVAVTGVQTCALPILSARQLQDPDLPQQVMEILAETGLEPRFLDLEITENNAMQSAASTMEALARLKAEGVRISIDDFGIGYSSLSYLRQLPIDTLKIDQSFVRNIATVRGDSAIVTAVIVMAHALKLDVVAEGVETATQLAFLGARRCDRIQGFYFSPAVPPEDLKPFLTATKPARKSPRRGSKGARARVRHR